MTTSAQVAQQGSATTSATAQPPEIWWTAESLRKAFDAINAELGPATADYLEVKISALRRTMFIAAVDPNAPTTVEEYVYNGDDGSVEPGTETKNDFHLDGGFTGDSVSAQVLAKAMNSARADTGWADARLTNVMFMRVHPTDPQPGIAVVVNQNNRDKTAYYDMNAALLKVYP
ncbi:hypothetical protein [Nocardia sp. NPDC046763]|uniref:hypothetical protein n=1 Tax=Nocardia sp. NPDC046763 TaxID=3155256 RepID=UPI0034037793